ncbi:hypothetical protein [Bifidobacterium catenulatum]|uniref:hypothetical protein n=1 Tax=Bifidobacterium catenulatum TaxID=1686 RepID=UPI003DA3194E
MQDNTSTGVSKFRPPYRANRKTDSTTAKNRQKNRSQRVAQRDDTAISSPATHHRYPKSS